MELKGMIKTHAPAVSILLVLICAAIPTIATPTSPIVRLPNEYITMNASEGTQSWFVMTLSDIPVGYDVTNGQYPGWCIQKDVSMTRNVNHTVLMYSSYDTAMPASYISENWDKINYVINHKQGDKHSIEQVLWYYLCNDPFPTDPSAQALVNDTELNGEGFVPGPGESIAIILEGVPAIQRTFLELTLPLDYPLGDFVWNDSNRNGLQDPSEPGIPGVTVDLYTTQGLLVNSTMTDTHGYYAFTSFPTAQYYLHFHPPTGYQFSPQDQGTDDTKDSDAAPSSGKTTAEVFNATNNDMSWDAGMYIPKPPGSQGGSNHAPTADGTAGEPYTGFIGEPIQFDGSRSYDRDGTIVKAYWMFGDGTTGDSLLFSHVYVEVGTYTVRLRVTDDDGASGTYTTHATILQPNRPPLPPQFTGTVQGSRNTSYVYTAVTTDPDTDEVSYLIDWSDGEQHTSPMFPSGHSIHTTHTWSTLGFYTITASAQDPSGATSAVTTVVVAIDVCYVGSFGYLINTDGSGPYDEFFCNATGNTTIVQQQSSGEYLIDADGDGTIDHQFNPATSALTANPTLFNTAIILLLVAVGVVILLILLWFLKSRRKKVRIITAPSSTSNVVGEWTTKTAEH
ncbi:MAG: PKD domain-containing protein [Candidatus Thermoplasmatota archaeon]|nr:PKD domain-containing protein [Candidatus Thermoplasmatota archaeon]